MSRARDLGDVGSKANFLDNVSTDLGDYSGQSIPHIIPDVLYPAVEGKDLAGVAFSGSYVYGTAHTDGRKYYYTDIKGSKPIKDPRIGGHFGSQRHKVRSTQRLEQETATHGKNVFSIDGREWMRAVDDWRIINNDNGNYLYAHASADAFIEIVGYFSDVTLLGSTSNSANRGFTTTLNGGSSSSENTGFEASVSSPLGTRYVDMSSAVNLNLGATLGINTLKIKNNSASDYFNIFNIELITQDTTSTANRSKIQIPSQNVVSYGKKFTVSAEGSSGHHYDPFNGFVNDTTLFSSAVDTATSLGLGAGTTYGAPWDKGSNDHIRPFNGGRVVKWLDSDGTIKTSVTMMPRNAQKKNTTASNEITPASATNTHTINFSDDAIENSLSEVAKTFEVREFGNGNANGGATGTYKDVSMLDTTGRDVAYVMDDGLTSLSAADHKIHSTEGIYADSDGKSLYITFIGTGIGVNCLGQDGSSGVEHRMYVDGIEAHYMGANPSTGDGVITIAQNLPYGTHIFEFKTITKGNADVYIREVTIHQPKKPPIPEDACVLADYMLMADYVPQTSNGIEKISKGVRLSDCSRDVFYDSTHSSTNSGFSQRIGYTGSGGFGFSVYNGTASATHTLKQEFYGDGIVFNYWESSATYRQHTFKLYIDDTLLTASNFSGVTVTSPYFTYNSSNGTFTQVTYASGQYYVSIKGLTLGHHTLKYSHDSTADTHQAKLSGFDIATPIHTSFHYTDGNKTNPKTGFETPFLNELVGGDRNMEQHNLVCSPDGKTWDQLTRDTSYIGNCVLSVGNGTGTWVHNDEYWVFDETRGGKSATQGSDRFNKDFAIAYDRHVCLRDGMYVVTFRALRRESTGHLYIKLNGTNIVGLHQSIADTYGMVESTDYIQMQRGDYIQVYDEGHGQFFSHFYITRA